MAVTGLSRTRASAVTFFLVLLALSQQSPGTPPPPGASPQTPLQQVAYVAEALSAGNAADAMTPFDKSCTNYDTIRDHFNALTNTSDLSNEVELVDNQEDKAQAMLKVNWTITIADRQTGFSDNRSAEINVTLSRASGKWKITSFSPVDIFNPQAHGNVKQ